MDGKNRESLHVGEGLWGWGSGVGVGEEQEPQGLGRQTEPLKPSPCPQKQGDSGLRAKEEGN